MTPTESAALREEAEKVARAIAPTQKRCASCRGAGEVRVKHGTVYITDSPDEIEAAYHFEPCRDCHSVVADALVAFAQRHGARERLRGRIDGLTQAARILRPVSRYIDQLEYIDGKLSEYAVALAALEKGEEVAG